MTQSESHTSSRGPHKMTKWATFGPRALSLTHVSLSIPRKDFRTQLLKSGMKNPLQHRGTSLAGPLQKTFEIIFDELKTNQAPWKISFSIVIFFLLNIGYILNYTCVLCSIF